VSRALADRLASLGVARERIEVVPSGVDLDRFAPRERDADGGGAALLGVGRLVPGKGFHLAIEALTRLRPAHPGIRLDLAGDGPERGRLEELARARGVADRVRFLGAVPHERVPECLRAADRLVLPSFAEGYPNVVAEAVAAGVPVVATSVGGIPEIVDAEVGDLATAPTVEAFAEALERSLRRRFSKAAFAARAGSLRWEGLLDHLRAVFERAIAAGPPA
jgi:glycosyltransferase involved in cell wall biosynthesis